MDIETIIFKNDKIIKKPTLESTPLDTTEKNKIVKVYAKVFAGNPWYEQFSCVHCGKMYGTPEATISSIMQKHNTCSNDKCTKPGVELELVPTYEGAFYNVEEKKIIKNLGEQILLDALQQEMFFGAAIKKDSEYIGFSWGYKLPTERSPSVWFDSVQQKLKDIGINTEKVFYAAELGVVLEYRNNGVGAKLIRERMNYAKNQGFESVVFRTVNPCVVRQYGAIFGADKGLELFRDPDTSKNNNDMWYMWDIRGFEGLK